MLGGAVRLMLALTTLVVPMPARAQDSPENRAAASSSRDAGIRTGHPAFQASLNRIAAGSALWRDAVAEIRETGRYALIVTPGQGVVTEPTGKKPAAFDAASLAEVAPVAGADAEVNVVLVVINLPLLEQVHAARGSMPAELEADLDRILVHEVYGHAMPYLLAGDLTGRCADPAPSQRASEACSIKRENLVRAELRLGKRVDSGLEGLSLARRDRF
jgi:hypothetical protein